MAAADKLIETDGITYLKSLNNDWAISYDKLSLKFV